MSKILSEKLGKIWTSGSIRAESYGLAFHTPSNSNEEGLKESQGFNPIVTLETVTRCSNAPAGPTLGHPDWNGYADTPFHEWPSSGHLSVHQDLFSMFAQFAVGADIAVKGDARDTQLRIDLTDLGVTITHGGLGQTDLRFAQAELRFQGMHR